MNDNKYYVTSPIYYVNDVPHIGHAYTTVICDIMARFARASDRETFFLTGTDEHGQKVEKAALARKMNPQSFTDEVSIKFLNLMQRLNISNDYFIRTSEANHKEIVANLWNQLVNTGDTYLGKYCGWYSIRDEAYYSEDELMPDGKAPTGAEVEWLEESSYFFRLSNYQDRLLEYYNNHDLVKPLSRFNEVKSFVKKGLNDLSISRTSFSWGIKVPNDDKHVIYVWLDALANYISALGYSKSSGSTYMKFWPANVHVVGKDILRFHAIYWPAFLMAVNLPLPKAILAHGWWTIEGQKMSKSLGNVVDPIALLDEFGVDQFRYFLAREVILGNDGNYSRTNLVNRINSELANKIGNLMYRTLSFINKYNEGVVPNVSIELAYNSDLLKMAIEYVASNFEYFDNFKINNILDNIIKLAEAANAYIDIEGPWRLKNIDKKKMLDVLYILLEALRYIAIMLKPFIPTSADLMLDQLSVPKDSRDFKNLKPEYAISSNSILPIPVPIFPRIEL